MQVVNCVSIVRQDSVRSWLDLQGFRTFVLDGTAVHDKASLLSQSALDLPHEEGMEARQNWDAWQDILWGGLYSLPDERIAVLWLHAETMLHHGLRDLLTAVDCLKQVAENLGNLSSSDNSPKMMVVFLMGIGPNFPEIERLEFIPDLGFRLRTRIHPNDGTCVS